MSIRLEVLEERLPIEPDSTALTLELITNFYELIKLISIVS